MLSFSSKVWFNPSPYTSTLAAITAFAATARAIFPLCHLGAAWTIACWNNNPCFGGWEPVFSDLNNAFSAPKTWIVLAGSDANLLRLPALPKILAPTAVPNIAERFGAIFCISASTWSSSFLRRSWKSKTCFAIACTISKLSSDISPPLLFDEIKDNISTFDSGKPAFSKTCFVNDSRFPAITICAYPLMLSIMLSNSGKCNPYHSLSLELNPFAILSISSKELIAWIIWRSGLSDITVTFDDENPNANSLSFPSVSWRLEAKPESTMICGFVACTLSNPIESIKWQSIEYFFRIASNDSSLTENPLWVEAK